MTYLLWQDATQMAETTQVAYATEGTRTLQEPASAMTATAGGHEALKPTLTGQLHVPVVGEDGHVIYEASFGVAVGADGVLMLEGALP
jgi:hypothetical protein